MAGMQHPQSIQTDYRQILRKSVNKKQCKQYYMTTIYQKSQVNFLPILIRHKKSRDELDFFAYEIF